LEEKAKHKLHVKNVGSVDLKKLMDLPMSKKHRETLEKLLPWLNSDEYYRDVVFDGKFFPCHLAPAHMETLARSCKVEEVTDEMRRLHPTRGTCHVFSVTEEKDLPPPDDFRERPIGHPIHNNNGVHQQVGVKFHTREGLRSPLCGKKGQVAVQLDFSAWFDQIELSLAQRSFYRFLMNGVLHQFVKLPMGATQSVEVAHAIAEALADGCDPSGEVTIQVHLDNVRFLGRRVQVLAAAAAFVDRCNEVGAILNEVKEKGELEGQVLESADFLGEHFDYKHGRVRVTEKIRNKIKLVWGRKDHWTNRDVASLYSLLFYASNTLAITPARFFNAMRLYRRLSQTLQAEPYRWMEAAPYIPQYVWAELEEWTGEILMNSWREIKPNPTSTKWIITDASEWGWGAICWDGRKAVSHQEAWEETYRHSQNSAYAEPEAILRALRRFITPGEAVTIYTDHQALKFAVPKGYSPSYLVNRVLLAVQRDFGRAVKIVYVPGKWNASDCLSRNRAAVEFDRQLTEAFIQATALEEENGAINPVPFRWVEEPVKIPVSPAKQIDLACTN